MAKIAFLGAGSFGFGRRLIGDLLSFPELLDSTIHLVDPDSERLELTHTYAQRIARELNLPTQIPHQQSVSQRWTVQIMSSSLFGWEPIWDQKRWMCKFHLRSVDFGRLSPTPSVLVD